MSPSGSCGCSHRPHAAGPPHAAANTAYVCVEFLVEADFVDELLAVMACMVAAPGLFGICRYALVVPWLAIAVNGLSRQKLSLAARIAPSALPPVQSILSPKLSVIQPLLIRATWAPRNVEGPAGTRTSTISEKCDRRAENRSAAADPIRLDTMPVTRPQLAPYVIRERSLTARSVTYGRSAASPTTSPRHATTMLRGPIECPTDLTGEPRGQARQRDWCLKATAEIRAAPHNVMSTSQVPHNRRLCFGVFFATRVDHFRNQEVLMPARRLVLLITVLGAVSFPMTGYAGAETTTTVPSSTFVIQVGGPTSTTTTTKPTTTSTQRVVTCENARNHGEYVASQPTGKRANAARSNCGKPHRATGATVSTPSTSARQSVSSTSTSTTSTTKPSGRRTNTGPGNSGEHRDDHPGNGKAKVNNESEGDGKGDGQGNGRGDGEG